MADLITAMSNESAARSRGEIEGAICREINQFEREYMGRGPDRIRAHLIGDLLIVRLEGVLTAAESKLVKTQLPQRGRELLNVAIIDTPLSPCDNSRLRKGCSG